MDTTSFDATEVLSGMIQVCSGDLDVYLLQRKDMLLVVKQPR